MSDSATVAAATATVTATSSTSVGALDNTMGVLFIGVIMAMGLWGASTLQVYYYYDRYPRDEKWIKALVACVWILDTCHQGMITHMSYTYLVTNFYNSEILLEIVPTLMSEVVPSATLISLVQGFFVMRIWRLRRNYVIVGFTSSLILANWIASMVYTSRALHFKYLTQLTNLFQLSRSINIMGAVTDLAIAGSLIYTLQTSRTGFPKSDTMINRLIFFALNTGLLTGLDALASMVTITVLPSTLIYLMFYLTCSRLYSNSLMATLNSRKTSGGNLGDDTGTFTDTVSQNVFQDHGVELDPSSQSRGFGFSLPHTLSIKVATQVETVHDQHPGDSKRSPSDSDTDVYQFGKSNGPS